MAGPVDPRLLREARPAAAYLVLCVAVGLVTAVLVVLQAELVASAVARAVHGAGPGQVGGAVLALGAVLAARAGLSWLTESLAARTSAAVRARLRRRLLEHVLLLGPQRLARHRAGEVTTLATRGLDALDPWFARYLPQLPLAALVPALVGLRMLVADPLSGLVVAVTVPLVPLFMVLVGLATRERTRRRWRALERLGGHFADALGGLAELRAYGRSRGYADAVREVSERHRRETMGTLRVAFLSSLVLELVATLSVALVAVSIGLRLVHGSVDLETALLVLLLAPEAYLPLRRVGEQYHAAAEGAAALESAFAVLGEPLPEHGDRPAPRPGRIELQDVAVTYEGADGPALEGLSLVVEPGTVLGLVGPSGAGKSTVLGLLLATVRPTRGRVLVDGTDLADVPPDAWRRHVAWVPQRPRLVAGTVAENVALGTTAAAAEVAAAASAAQVDLPLDLVVGERGATLSAGQRRRVALARALLRDAPLLLLDEPSEDLDDATEAQVLAALAAQAGGRTVVLVTHRRAALDLCDAVEVVVPPLATAGSAR
ncbi:thiol reductant ABC exporter subunit CydD [Vallicoccus soli]|uniref:Thiol reductant ABC exporter subunit CydD n=1 Tax=Vallicoccus soli TaxID=2339232 RepID=A0A3A3Z3U2_9ACTN|nr:thiol reductant ABC exporter subunit CydD [Vallicoccus soli]RJK97623.1 thiol reductant ABC exporter subunit CydD [Vallicoccus soli]